MYQFLKLSLVELALFEISKRNFVMYTSNNKMNNQLTADLV